MEEYSLSNLKKKKKKKKQVNKQGVLKSISLYVVMLPKGIKIPLWKVKFINFAI